MENRIDIAMMWPIHPASNYRAGVDAGIPLLSASEHQRPGTTHRGCSVKERGCLSLA